MDRKMPVFRDVSVPEGNPAEDAPAEDAAQGQGRARTAPTGANTVTVIGGGGKDDVLFSTDQAKFVKWNDAEGRTVAMLIRINRDFWGLSLRGDDDWDEMVRLYGLSD